MFAGFKSRWMILFRCAASSASAICRAMANASPVGTGPTAQPIGQRLAVDELQHQRWHAAGLFEPVDGADVRMIERREHARFAARTAPAARGPP